MKIAHLGAARHQDGRFAIVAAIINYPDENQGVAHQDEITLPNYAA